MLAVEGLTKRFGGFTAVNDVSFAVERGEILGLIGPNGSGKSTIFNMLSGTLAPNRGSIRFEGRRSTGWGRRGSRSWRSPRRSPPARSSCSPTRA